MLKQEKKNSDARIKANNKYNAKTYKKISLNVRISDYEKIKNYIDAMGISANSYIIELIKKDLQSKGISI